METILFYLLAVCLVGFSVLVVTARNPVRSAVYLISALLTMAGLFFLLKAEFVGAVQILVYVGGIMVLFLFVLMLVNVEHVVSERSAGRNWRAGAIVGGVLLIEIIFLLLRGSDLFRTREPAGMIEGATRNTEAVGELLFTGYLLPFEIASVLLLVAMVGAVVLAKKELR